MQKWEYLELFLNYGSGKWRDSMGREGALSSGGSAYGGNWYHSGGLLNDLGQQGWELVAVEAYPITSSGGSIGTGMLSAKWVFKRPSAVSAR